LKAGEFCKEAAQIFVSGASDHYRRGKARVKIKNWLPSWRSKNSSF